jgi:Uncharacterized alpha/beta hydrolase domain (DUF2235)
MTRSQNMTTASEHPRPLALIGGAFGVGLAKNVRHLYAFLSRNYRGLDEKVFAFGFSRGAYTIRMLIGLVRNQGLVDPELPEQLFQREVLHRWDAFRSERFSRFKRTLAPQPERHEVETRGRVPEFEFVGLWDTVAAYGLPIDEIQHAIDLYIYPFSFSDRHLSSIVKCAYHALSLDDERGTFHPVLWDESDPSDHARVQQVWFPGVHSNVGGGYPKDGLAYLSLEWMVTKAKILGLRFIDADFTEIKQQTDPYDDLYDSRAGLSGYYRYSPRPVSTLCKAGARLGRRDLAGHIPPGTATVLDRRRLRRRHDASRLVARGDNSLTGRGNLARKMAYGAKMGRVSGIDPALQTAL